MEQRLSRRLQALARVSAALAARSQGGLSRAFEEAIACDAADGVEEVLLQSYLFLGYPLALNGFAHWRRLSGRSAPEAVADDWAEWVRRGVAVCGAVYGSQYERLRENVRSLHPDMERWMLAEGYGKVLGRGGLSLMDRELVIVAQLAALGVDRQLHSHLRGCLNVGVEPWQVEQVLAIAAEYAEEGGASAEAVWSEVSDRWTARSEEEEG